MSSERPDPIQLAGLPEEIRDFYAEGPVSSGDRTAGEDSDELRSDDTAESESSYVASSEIFEPTTDPHLETDYEPDILELEEDDATIHIEGKNNKIYKNASSQIIDAISEGDTRDSHGLSKRIRNKTNGDPVLDKIVDEKKRARMASKSKDGTTNPGGPNGAIERTAELAAYDKILENKFDPENTVYNPNLSVRQQVNLATREDVKKARIASGLSEGEWLKIGYAQYLSLEKTRFDKHQEETATATTGESDKKAEKKPTTDKEQILKKIDAIREGELEDEDNDYEFGFERTETKDGARRYYLTYNDPETDEEKKAIVNREAFFNQRLYQSELVSKPERPDDLNEKVGPFARVRQRAGDFIGSLIAREAKGETESNQSTEDVPNKSIRNRIAEFLIALDPEVDDKAETAPINQEADSTTEEKDDAIKEAVVKINQVLAEREHANQVRAQLFAGEFDGLTLFVDSKHEKEGQQVYTLIDQSGIEYNDIPYYVYDAYLEQKTGKQNTDYPNLKI